jgi:NADH:ubiquinone oxidoreductase subunit K
MKSKASVRPSKSASVVLVIMGILFLAFGVALSQAAEGEARPYVMMFLVVWVAACGSMILYGLSAIFSKRPPSITEIEIESMEYNSSGSEMDFSSKLRKLESLLKDGLISEDEYRTKRSEIMSEKW